MAQLNWTDYEDPTELPKMPDGAYTVRVAAAEERVSQKGETYFNLTLESTEFGLVVAYDVAMLEGKGANIGMCKLKALGFSEDDTNITDVDLLNRKAIVLVETREFRERRRKEVALEFDDHFKAGYAPASSYEALKGRLVVKEGDGWSDPDPGPGPSEFDETPF